jgi:hypothetical protein
VKLRRFGWTNPSCHTSGVETSRESRAPKRAKVKSGQLKSTLNAGADRGVTFPGERETCRVTRVSLRNRPDITARESGSRLSDSATKAERGRDGWPGAVPMRVLLRGWCGNRVTPGERQSGVDCRRFDVTREGNWMSRAADRGRSMG